MTTGHRTELVGDKYGWHVECSCGWRTWESRADIAAARADLAENHTEEAAA